MKYIIEVELIQGTNLYKAKGFNTLVFDELGLSKLEEYQNEPAIEVGDLVKTKKGVAEYIYKGRANDEDIANVINVNSGRYTTIAYDNLCLVEKADRIIVPPLEIAPSLEDDTLPF